jgi:hypothetical protein
MKPLHYYSIRVTTLKGACSRRIAQIPETEAPNTEAFSMTGPTDKVEYKYLGFGVPLHKAFGPLARAFHTEAQKASYERGLQGHSVRPMNLSELDDFGYLGEADAEIVWDMHAIESCEDR